MSPEGISYAMDQYLEALRHQVNIAKAFYLGKVAEGMQGLFELPEDVRTKIDQLIWEAAGGEAIDPTEEASREVISEAILYSVEERMGMHE